MIRITPEAPPLELGEEVATPTPPPAPSKPAAARMPMKPVTASSYSVPSVPAATASDEAILVAPPPVPGVASARQVLGSASYGSAGQAGVEVVAGAEGMASALVMLFLTLGLVFLVASTVQFYNSPAYAEVEKRFGDTISLWQAIWLPAILMAGLVLFLVAPAGWLGMFITSKVLKVRYSGSVLLNCMGIAVSPAVVAFLCGALNWLFFRDHALIGAVVGLLPVLAALPVSYLLIRAIFGLDWVKSLAAFGFCLPLVGGAWLAAVVLTGLYGASNLTGEMRRLEKLADRRNAPQVVAPMAPQVVAPMAPVAAAPANLSPADSQVNAMPMRRPALVVSDGVQYASMLLRGDSSDLPMRVYLPLNSPTGNASLPCVLIAAAGGTSVSGMMLGDGDTPEHLPYVKAGFAVVAYSVSGQLAEDGGNVDLAIRGFVRSDAGQRDAQRALLTAEEVFPEIDPNRVYAAGHSSAGTLALLLAARNPAIKACVAYAPAVNTVERIDAAMQRELEGKYAGIMEFVKTRSPASNPPRVPVLVFHAQDDEVVPFVESASFAGSHRDKVELIRAASGGHFNSMISEGLPRGVKWLTEKASAVAPAPRVATTDIPGGGPGEVPQPGAAQPNGLPPAGVGPQPGPGMPAPAPATAKLAAFASITDWKDGEGSDGLIVPATPSEWFATYQSDNRTNHTITRWSTKGPSRDKSIKLGTTMRQTYSLSADGQFLLKVSGFPLRQAELWSFDTGEMVKQIPLSDSFGDPTALGFLDTQSFVIIWQKGRQFGLEIFDIKRGASRKQVAMDMPEPGMMDYACTAENVAIAPDGKTLAYVDGSRQLRVLDTLTGRPRRSIPLALMEESSCSVPAMLYSADGKRLALLVDGGRRGEGGAVVFHGAVVGGQLTAINFPKSLREMAGFTSPLQRFGRVMDWVGDGTMVMAYGQMLVDLRKGIVASTVYEPAAGQAESAPPLGCANQCRLTGDTFLLAPAPDAFGRARGSYRVLTLEAAKIR